MAEKISFKIQQDSVIPLANLKKWCRANRVPLGRLLNAVIQATEGMPSYAELKPLREFELLIRLPRQVNLDSHIRYQERKKYQLI